MINYDNIDLVAPVPPMPTLGERFLVRLARMLTKHREDERDVQALLTVARVVENSDDWKDPVLAPVTEEERFLVRTMRQLVKAKTKKQEQTLLLLLQRGV